MASEEPVTTEFVKKLIAKKDGIEEEIKALSDVLDSQGVGMDGSLIDAESFPRGDIDIYSVRHARSNIIKLQNDHKSLMSEIETSLHILHEKARNERVAMDTEKSGSKQSPAADMKKPFAIIEHVAPKSAASIAGLVTNDEIIQFGSINSENFTSLQSIGALVKNSGDRSIAITVLRNGSLIHISLKPSSTSGPLGCKIVPKKS